VGPGHHFDGPPAATPTSGDEDDTRSAPRDANREEADVKLTVLTAITGLILLTIIFELVRRRQLREKYAMLWLAVGVVVVPLGLFPRVLDRLTVALGVASGASLVLFLGVTVLLLICLHLSWEVSRLEEETRSLAEDLALLRTALRERVPDDQR
jgi:hypothetical protein